MSMEVTAWTQLHRAMNANDDRRPISRVTLKRIAAFARPHRRWLAPSFPGRHRQPTTDDGRLAAASFVQDQPSESQP